jgi:hypothetical protein
MSNKVLFDVHYVCPYDGEAWSQESDCTCNDRCPNCEAEIEPVSWQEILEDGTFGPLVLARSSMDAVVVDATESVQYPEHMVRLARLDVMQTENRSKTIALTRRINSSAIWVVIDFSYVAEDRIIKEFAATQTDIDYFEIWKLGDDALRAVLCLVRNMVNVADGQVNDVLFERLSLSDINPNESSLLSTDAR